MPDNEKIREINDRLEGIAPWPGSDATAPGVARYLAVRAQVRFTQHVTPFSRGEVRLDPVMCELINAQYAAASALLALHSVDPGAASAAACEIALSWNDGQGVDGWLWAYLGAAKGEIAKLAEELAAERLTVSIDRDVLSSVLADAHRAGPSDPAAFNRAAMAAGLLPAGAGEAADRG